jgi:hypothetical protein
MFKRTTNINDLLDGDEEEWSGPCVLTWAYDGAEEDFQASRPMQYGVMVVGKIDKAFSKRLVPWQQIRSIEYAPDTIRLRRVM